MSLDISKNVEIDSEESGSEVDSQDSYDSEDFLNPVWSHC